MLLPGGGKKCSSCPLPAPQLQVCGGKQLDSERNSCVSPTDPATHISTHPSTLSRALVYRTFEDTSPCACAVPRVYQHTDSPLDACSSIHSFTISSRSLSNERKAVCLSFKPWVIGWGTVVRDELAATAPLRPPIPSQGSLRDLRLLRSERSPSRFRESSESDGDGLVSGLGVPEPSCQPHGPSQL